MPLTLDPPPDVRALIFDWDGTLVDSQATNYRALRDALAVHQVHLAEEWFNARTGISTAEMIEVLLHDTGQRLAVPTEAVVARRDTLFLAQSHTVQEHSRVTGVARSFRGRLPIAVASGGSRPIIETVMRHTGLDETFDLLVAREDVTRGKPAPDLFELAAERLGINPEDCLVYEDSDEGIEAAQKAGMRYVDVRPLR